VTGFVIIIWTSCSRRRCGLWTEDGDELSVIADAGTTVEGIVMLGSGDALLRILMRQLWAGN